MPRACMPIERGKDIGGRTMIAFGGAAPLHACRLAEKLGIDDASWCRPAPASARPSASCARRSPTRSCAAPRCGSTPFDAGRVNALLAEMDARGDAPWSRRRSAERRPWSARIADMRYVGQGHEIPVAAAGAAAVDGRRRRCSRPNSKRLYAQIYGLTGSRHRRSKRDLVGAPSPRRRARLRRPAADGRAAAQTARQPRHLRSGPWRGRRRRRSIWRFDLSPAPSSGPCHHRRGRDLDRGRRQFPAPSSTLSAISF